MFKCSTAIDFYEPSGFVNHSIEAVELFFISLCRHQPNRFSSILIVSQLLCTVRAELMNFVGIMSWLMITNSMLIC